MLSINKPPFRTSLTIFTKITEVCLLTTLFQTALKLNIIQTYSQFHTQILILIIVKLLKWGFGVLGSDPYALFSAIRYSDPSDA